MERSERFLEKHIGTIITVSAMLASIAFQWGSLNQVMATQNQRIEALQQETRAEMQALRDENKEIRTTYLRNDLFTSKLETIDQKITTINNKIDQAIKTN